MPSNHARRDSKNGQLFIYTSVCYTAESVRPIRMRWTPERRTDAVFLAQVAQRPRTALSS